MTIQGYFKGYSVTEVSFHEVNGATDEELIAAAMAHAGETRESLFGTHVSRIHDCDYATVSLYTD